MCAVAAEFITRRDSDPISSCRPPRRTQKKKKVSCLCACPCPQAPRQDHLHPSDHLFCSVLLCSALFCFVLPSRHPRADISTRDVLTCPPLLSSHRQSRHTTFLSKFPESGSTHSFSGRVQAPSPTLVVTPDTRGGCPTYSYGTHEYDINASSTSGDMAGGGEQRPRSASMPSNPPHHTQTQVQVQGQGQGQSPRLGQGQESSIAERERRKDKDSSINLSCSMGSW